MTRGFSIYLDLLRVSAAFVVLLSHYGYPRFSEGRWLWVRDYNLGSDAVVIFFVLSGFVIAHVAHNKSGGIDRFAFDRATRLISVALPALLLTFALDGFGAAIAPEIYDGWWSNPLPFWEMLLRGLSFSNEWSGLETRLGTNGPYWSLSYEAAYYALFAAGFYLRGVRRFALLALGLWVFGFNILILMPTWLAGVWLYHRLKAQAPRTRAVAAAYTLLPVLFYASAQYTHLPAQLYAITAPLDHAWDLRFSDEILWNWLLGLLVGAHLIGMHHLLGTCAFARSGPVIRWLAGGSFSLYLVHYPLLQFTAILPLDALHGPAKDAAVLGFVTLVCFGFAALFERPLAFWRGLILRLRRSAGQQEPA